LILEIEHVADFGAGHWSLAGILFGRELGQAVLNI